MCRVHSAAKHAEYSTLSAKVDSIAGQANNPPGKQRRVMSIAVLSDMDLGARRASAVSLTKRLVARLADIGVDAKIFGSLSSGKFNAQSDIDLLVTECPRHLKYKIEGLVEDGLPGFRFDVVYLDEIPAHRRHRFLETVTDAGDLR
jgi:predicted nucleotidyltransferase